MLTQLTHLHYLASANDASGTAAFTRSLSGLTALVQLQLNMWPSSTSAADHSAWRALMGSLGSLRRLSDLHLIEWRLNNSCSTAYFSELGPTLTSLRALTRLTLEADMSTPQTAPTVAADDSAAGVALVRAIGSLTQLQGLEITALRRVSVGACCQHLASLSSITHLMLRSLALPVLPALAAAAAAGGTFEQLLVGMTRLDDLTLNDVGLTGRSAMRVVPTVVPTLLHLQRLSLQRNHLGGEVCNGAGKQCATAPCVALCVAECGKRPGTSRRRGAWHHCRPELDRFVHGNPLCKIVLNQCMLLYSHRICTRVQVSFLEMRITWETVPAGLDNARLQPVTAPCIR